MAESLSRKQEKRCARCGHPWWSWGLKRDVCQVCEPFTAAQAKVLVEKINANDPLVRL